MMSIAKSIGSRSNKEKKANDAPLGTSAKRKWFNFFKDY